MISSFYVSIPNWYFILIITGWLLFTFLGSYFIQWNYYFKSLTSNNKIKENHVAVTFDDGPNPDFTPKALELLAKYKASATFFCIGKNISTAPHLLREIIERGHSIGNHTYTHSNNFGFFSPKSVKAELKKTNDVVYEHTGLKMKLFRPAFGITNPNIKKAIKHLGLTSIGWNKRSYDTTILSEERIFNRITRRLKKGDIILLHDSSDKSIRVLERLLLFLKANNLRSVKVDQLLEIEPYA